MNQIRYHFAGIAIIAIVGLAVTSPFWAVLVFASIARVAFGA